MKTNEMSEDEYLRHSNNYAGWCTTCARVIDGCSIEPDARGYRCPECHSYTGYRCQECHNYTLYGLEDALLSGFIEIASAR